MGPIIAIILVIVFAIAFVGSSFSAVFNGGTIRYDEATFQRYADSRYAEEFGQSSAYEDNLLIVFLVDEESENYYTIAWIGDNVRSEVSDMFGNEYTALGRAFSASIPEMFENSLSKDLRSVVQKMKTEVLRVPDRFEDTPTAVAIAPRFVNHSSFRITDATVQGALDDFYLETGISMSLVVAEMSDVFEKGLDGDTYIMLVVGIGLLALAVFLIVRTIKNKKNGGNDGDGGNSQDGPNVNGENDPRYNPYSNMRF